MYAFESAPRCGAKPNITMVTPANALLFVAKPDVVFMVVQKSQERQSIITMH